MTLTKIVEFAQDHGFDSVEKENVVYKGYDVYSPKKNRKGSNIIGFPHFILVKGDEIIMHIDDNFEVLDLISPPEIVEDDE